MGGLLCCTVVKIVYHPYCHKRQSAMKMGGGRKCEAQGLKLEARGAESGGGVLGEGSQSPPL